MKTMMIVGALVAQTMFVFAEESTSMVCDQENTPYVRAIRALDAKDWGRFAYWAEMTDYSKWDGRIKSGLGHCYRKGLGGKKQDGKRAFDILSDAVRHSDTAKTSTESNEVSRAQLELGICYQTGMGVASNHVEAAKWYRKAADRNFGAAQYWLGICYRNGTGVKKDDVEAMRWIKKSAEEGYDIAQYGLGQMFRHGYGVSTNEAEAARWYRKAAEQGNADAQSNLGWCYLKGFGVVKDGVEAVKWYRKAAEQGNAKAQFGLGWCYHHGVGVGQNENEALAWYRKAVSSGDKDAPKAIAILKDRKSLLVQRERNLDIREKHVAAMALASVMDGGKQDKKDEYELFRDIASHENDDGLGEEERLCVGNALAALGTYHTQGVPGLVQKNLAKAFDYYVRAAKFGNAIAQNNLGMCYERGDGVAKDYLKAIEWFGKALEAGFEKAQMNIERIKRIPGVTTEYVVRRGDMFTTIAYKHGCKVQTLRVLNSLSPNDNIRVGQKLIVPVPNR